MCATRFWEVHYSKDVQSSNKEKDKNGPKKCKDVMRPESNRVGSKEYWATAFGRPSAWGEFVDTNIGTYSSKV